MSILSSVALDPQRGVSDAKHPIKHSKPSDITPITGAMKKFLGPAKSVYNYGFFQLSSRTKNAVNIVISCVTACTNTRIKNL